MKKQHVMPNGDAGDIGHHWVSFLGFGKIFILIIGVSHLTYYKDFSYSFYCLGQINYYYDPTILKSAQWRHPKPADGGTNHD
ncbi:MAG: hypothetical protein OSA51_04080 [Octadecabacter sp.]|nr:hypothetical protein [Octadecabacter sp.]